MFETSEIIKDHKDLFHLYTKPVDLDEESNNEDILFAEAFKRTCEDPALFDSFLPVSMKINKLFKYLQVNSRQRDLIPKKMQPPCAQIKELLTMILLQVLQLLYSKNILLLILKQTHSLHIKSFIFH